MSAGQVQPEAAPPVPAELQVHQEPAGGRRLVLRGELDLDSATRLRGPLLDHFHARSPVTLDLRAVDYLSSAGVGCCHRRAPARRRLSDPGAAPADSHSLATRVLAMTGLAHTVPVVIDAPPSTVR